MTIAQLDQVIASRLLEPGDLHLDRTDISFHNVDVNRVRVTITVHNRGLERSRRTEAVLRAAPLGAAAGSRSMRRVRAALLLIALGLAVAGVACVGGALLSLDWDHQHAARTASAVKRRC